MKAILLVLFVGLFMVGCGEQAQKEQVQAVVDKWAEWEANPEPHGGLEALAKIKEAKEGGFAFLHLHYNEITDVSPLKGLTNLEYLFLKDSTKHHTL